MRGSSSVPGIFTLKSQMRICNSSSSDFPERSGGADGAESDAVLLCLAASSILVSLTENESSAHWFYSFGILSVLLIMALPLIKQNSDDGCHWSEAISTTPSGKSLPT